jgi:autotransporter strand-loop-strand O-heptosyltransferase
MKLKLMYVVPHLSTGGMPQFVLKRIESLLEYKNEIEVFLVEYSQFSDTYIVQRNKIIELLDVGHFFTLGWFTEPEKKYQLIDIIKENKIDIVHIEEIPEGFESFNKIPLDILNQLYDNNRTWKIVESCHNIWFDGNSNKKLHPDYYSFVTPYHLTSQFNKLNTPKKVWEYPIEDKVSDILKEYSIYDKSHRVPTLKKIIERENLQISMTKTHILNVGLWTEGKNQKEGIEVARLLENTHPDLHFHFIGNQASNFENYWGPIMNNLPKNVTVWGEREDVETFMRACDVLMFNSTWECNPLVVREAINYGMKIMTRNLPQYMGMFDEYITPIKSNNYEDIKNTLLELLNSNKTYEIDTKRDFKKELLDFYKEVNNVSKTLNNPITKSYNVNNHFVVNPFIEISGEEETNFEITFIDEGGNVIYQNNLAINSWVKLNREYYTKWAIRVKEDNNLIFSNILNLENRRVYISFGSKSLGDSLAWIPYCEEFRKKHNCELIVSTFLNDLFKDQYPNIKFVEPGETVYDIYAQYQLGWFYNENGEFDSNKHPFDFKKQPLQKTATDILGLDYVEIRPELKLPNKPKKKKVGIGFHSTAQAKYWNNPDGWQVVIDYLDSLGYECMIYSKEGNGYMNNFYPKGVTLFKGGNLQEVINDLSTCEFFIGLGSGLSWLAWACELPVILISGFSEKWAETTLDTYRVINEDVCHGCFNNDRLNAGDWNWCPLHKGTNRQFECTKKITSDMVIKEINKIMNKDIHNDTVTIILSHANTNEKREILIELLNSIETKKLLSTNYPIDDEIKSLCDYVVYDKENPILLKEEFENYNAYFYWVINENGHNIKKYFDYEHGYAAYKLIQNGLIESKKQGFKIAHITNYDYLIDKNTLKENLSLLQDFDCVFYFYENKPYIQNSYCTGFFTGRVNELIKSFTFYQSKNDYYNFEGPYKILEIIMYDIINRQNFKIKELKYEDLSKTSIVNKIINDYKIKEINKIMNKEKSFDWGTQNDWYIKTINEEIFENKIYERFFEVEKGDIVLDVGASLGPFTFSILNKNPKHVFCFEPCEEEFPTLVKNTIGYPVTHIMKGISNVNNLTPNDKLFNSVNGLQTEMESITFKKFINLYGIDKIDFLKTDCEGGEYDIFNDENYDFIKNNVKKISGEWHLNESYYKGSKEKFRKFRDTYLKNMSNHQVFSVDGVDIKWDLWNEHFIEYYNEVIIYIDNR